jgi:hypothetical protein
LYNTFDSMINTYVQKRKVKYVYTVDIYVYIEGAVGEEDDIEE